ncbi:MAG: hypothetical protein EP335_08480 [Alphaproteobacteria bacterium]|nr:MAG: hypothetical protein EP335_08480 [Alphaproteobacteria bacterium]
MANSLQPITVADHANVKIKTDGGFAHAANIHIVPVTIHEFAEVQANFPIVFVKDKANNSTRVVAILGLAPGENLFVKDGRWLGTYIPAHVARMPFAAAAVEEGHKYAVCLEEGSPLIGDEGEALYNADGTDSELLQRVKAMLEQLVAQEAITTAFVQALEEANLLKPIAIQMVDGENKLRELNGLLTVDGKRLHELPADKLAKLHERGFLGGAYAINHSFAQLKRLLQYRNESGGLQIAKVHVRDLDAEAAA